MFSLPKVCFKAPLSIQILNHEAKSRYVDTDLQAFFVFFCSKLVAQGQKCMGNLSKICKQCIYNGSQRFKTLDKHI